MSDLSALISGSGCDWEYHIGNTPRSIMTKGKSRLPGPLYGNFHPGNEDKLMISYRREPKHDYMMAGACDVFYKGEIHFFGGQKSFNLTRQHFVIETDRGKYSPLTKMRQEKNLPLDFEYPSCLQMTYEDFWTSKTFVRICFGKFQKNSCYSFDDKKNTLNFLGYSNVGHYKGGLQRYQRHLLTVGNKDDRFGNKKTELMETKNGDFPWTFVDPEYTFKTLGKSIFDHSMMTIESSNINKEYIILIGGVGQTGSGYRAEYNVQKTVFKFNGTWSPFGELNKPRWDHSSIYWNGAVYVIGGRHDWDDSGAKMEIWKIKDSPNEFQTTVNWPELFNWRTPYLFIVSDSFFPDYLFQ